MVYPGRVKERKKTLRVPRKRRWHGLSPGNNKLKRSLANTFELAGLTCSPRARGRGRIETSILTFAPRFNRFPGLSFEQEGPLINFNYRKLTRLTVMCSWLEIITRMAFVQKILQLRCESKYFKIFIYNLVKLLFEPKKQVDCEGNFRGKYFKREQFCDRYQVHFVAYFFFFKN